MSDFSDEPMDTEQFREIYPLAAGAEPASAAAQDAGDAGQVLVPTVATGSVRLDDRVRRMVDNAVRAFPVVVLVGPPGTGKGYILTDLIRRVNADPESFGFAKTHEPAWPDPLRRTPDESTSLSDLVGSWVPDAAKPGSLRWSSGFILDALAADRWVILDELNRADLDKILGPLLSWLAGEPVELGTLTSDPLSPRLILDWDPTRHESSVDPIAGLGVPDDGTAATVSFLGGRDFRLLGTFNPQDAHRVFSLGMALGRRLRTVPIPPVSEDDLNELLTERYPELPPPVLDRIRSLYMAHQATPRTRVGPALFLEMPRYLVTGLAAAGIDPSTAAGTLITELLQESYVICLGRVLRAMSPEVRGQLGSQERMLEAFSPDDWSWIEESIVDLG